VTVRKYNDYFTFWLVLDEVTKLCTFVRTDKYALSVFVVVSVMTEVETSIVPNCDALTVLLSMLELTEVYFCIS
jgi:hypothetical protein